MARPRDIAARFARVNGINLAYRLHGEGPPLVLIMGYRLNQAAWPESFIEALASAVSEINAAGGKAQSIVLDVTVAEKIDGALAEAEAKFGPIHAVVNNAGITATKAALDQDERAWDSVIDTNLKGVWLVAQAAARG